MKERIFIKRAGEQIQIEEWIRSQLVDVRVGQIELGHTPLGLRVIIHTPSPGLVIGPGGEKIRELSECLKTKFNVDNPQIDVQKITDPDLDPMIVAQGMASSLERNVNVKKLGNFALERVMRAGAIGCEIIVGGKLSGEKARSERFTAGYLKKCGNPAKQDVICGYATATPKLGNIGIKVYIMINHSDKKIEVVRADTLSSEEASHPANAIESLAKSGTEQQVQQSIVETSATGK